MNVRVAAPDEIPEALHLLVCDLAESQREQRIDALTHLLKQGQISPEGLFLAERQGHPCGAMLVVPAPGRAALVHPPGCDPPDDAVEDALIRTALDWVDRLGCTLVHSLVDAEEQTRAVCLLRHGFESVSRLWYFHHDLEELPDRPGAPPLCTMIPSSQEPERFGATVPATYPGSLDFPELTSLRTLPDILDSHRLGTLHDPDRWWLLNDGQDVGVALVGLLADTGEWDLSYIGLVPEVRGRGLAGAVLAEILHQASELGIPRVVLAVDERNRPAWRLYRRLGFTPDDARTVLLRMPRR